MLAKIVKSLVIPAYVINLDRATKRRVHIEAEFAEARIPFRRVAAIDGKFLELQPSFYSENSYRWRHGRETNPPEIGCYLSHLEAFREFLATDSEVALICEDDISFGSDLPSTIAAALIGPRFWNVLRLSGLSEGRPLRVSRLDEKSWLCINFGRIKGTGAYLIDRKAALTYTTQLLPMKLPFDHAFDREWCHGLASASMIPFPVNQIQKRFGSAIQTYAQPKLSIWRRWLTTYPYQAGNEVMRCLYRSALYLTVKWRCRRELTDLTIQGQT